MEVAVFTYTKQGCEVAKVISDKLKDCEIALYASKKFCEGEFKPIEKPSDLFYGELFSKSDALIFVGACGIAVREIAPHIKNKQTDPAVICIDVKAKFVIPLLSGHIGQANKLAGIIAEILGSVAVITTATDVNQKFAADFWAAENGYVIGNINAAKIVSAEILERDIPLCSEFPIVSELPNGIYAAECGDCGIYIGVKTVEPFTHTLRIIPPVLNVGIGCRKEIPSEKIEAAVNMVFEKYKLDKRAIRKMCSIDLKAQEKGLLEFSQSLNVPVSFYAAEELNLVSGNFEGSDFVKSVTGVDNVCERAAMLDADFLAVPKTVLDGVTIAVAIKNTEVCFE